VGRFTFDRRLGSGAYATVWLAQDSTLASPVAIKVLADNWMANLDVRQRFLEEARLQRQADSERVATVYDLGELPDGRPYIVMTYADRGTLADRLSTHELTIPAAIRLALEVSEGISDLHHRGILHRDLKPTNILFQSGPATGERVLIADLGLAKRLDQASQFTFGAGTLGYAAPEQLEIGGDLDVRVDVYSLGALVRAMVFGSSREPMSSEVASPALIDVLERATSSEREDRYPTAAEFAAALASAGEHQVDLPLQTRTLQTTTVDVVDSQPASGEPRQAVEPSSGHQGSLSGPSLSRLIRRHRAVGLTTLLACIALISGVVSVVVDRPGTVALNSRAIGISLEIPERLSGEIQASRWLSATSSSPISGFAVSPDITGWADDQATKPGVFLAVGSSSDRGLVQASATHPECRKASVIDWEGPQFETRSAMAFAQCPSGVEYVEVVADAIGRDRLVYLQAKNTDVQDALAILDSIAWL
jgi:eukaryotic-like serine/threonine-protein kinase